VHADHVGGLAGAEKNRMVGTTWYGDVFAGTRAKIENVEIEVKWPNSAEGLTPNNSSIAVLISSPDFTLFAAGDIEPPAQSQLISRIGAVDIYKVAHHGSRFQDLDLLRELAPRIAVVSVGATNTYGHPAPSTISALTQLGAKVLRTDIDGAVAIRAASHQFSLQRSKRWFRFFSWS
jgi:competence protein ComEC